VTNPDDMPTAATPYGAPSGYPPPTASAGKSRRTLWIVLGCVAGALVLCCGSITAIGALVSQAGKTTTVHFARATHAGAQPPAVTLSHSPTTPAATPTRAAAATKTTAPVAPPPTTAAPAPKPASPPDREICRVDDVDGTYYLLVTSALSHNFELCAGRPLYSGTIDTLLDQPNMDRCCILPDQYTAVHPALVGVYSDTKGGNLRAAQAYCDANGAATTE
jgi:hypothetical protein